MCAFFHSIKSCIGSGEFGAVYKGVWLSGSEEVEVAVKSLKKVATVDEKVRFLQEAAIMGQFDHPYIVEIYGIIASADEVIILMSVLKLLTK